MAKALTVKAVEQAKAGASRRELPDALVPGLRLVVQPSGAKSWAVRYRYQGKPAKLTLGAVLVLDKGATEPEAVLGAPATLTGARTLARAALAGVAAGKNPAAAKKQAKAAETDAERLVRNSFPTAAKNFINRYAKPRNRSWMETARLLGLVLDPNSDEPDPAKRPLVARKGGLAEKWGQRQVQDITRADIIDHLDGMVDRGSAIAANRTLAALRKLYNWLVERGVVEASPFAGVKAPAAERSRDRVLTDAELRLVWRASDKLGHPFGPMVKALLLTGQRRDEVAAMKWSELDLDAGLWTLERSRTKNNTAHQIGLPAAVVDLLKVQPRIGKSGYVFTTNGDSHVSGYSRAKSRLDKEIMDMLRADATEARADPETVKPLPEWRLHDLRRTMASGMARLGVAVQVVEAVLNHRSGTIRGVAAVYNRHSYLEEGTRALEAWADHVQAVVEGKPAGGNVVALRRA